MTETISDCFLSEDDHFLIMEKYFTEKGPVFHQFESYEYMYDTLLQKIIDETPSIHIETKTVKYKATFGQVYVEKASFIDDGNVIRYLTPQESRLHDLTYESPVFVDIYEEFWELNENKEFEKMNEIEHKKIMLMKIPVMVRSSRCNLYGMNMEECIANGECINDPGGYFIINGKERALICQERLNYNQVYVFESNDDKCPYSADIRSMSEETGHSVLLQARMNKEGKNICFMIPYMSKEVPAGAVFKALGMTSEDIVRFVNPSSKEERVLVDRMIRESILLIDKKSAIAHISKATMHKVEDDEERRIIYTEQVIENELFPHMGISTAIEKCIFLGDMLNKLFRVSLRKRLEDDRDNVSLKRIEGPGVLVADLFRMSMKRYCDNLKKYLEKRQDIITSMNRTNSITSVFRHTFSTGNWAAQKNTYIRTGVSQIMSRLTYPATISHLRRVVIPVGKEGKNVKIRQIHPTQTFFIDIIESPEGKSIGIVKNLSLLANITTGCNSVLVKEILERCHYVFSTEKYFDREDWNTIYLNGTLIGLTHRATDVYKELSELRKIGIFNNQVSFYHDKDDREIRVFCDHGRYIRPVMVVEQGNILKMSKKDDLQKSWTELVENDIIRYIDSNEVENSLIAMVPSDLEKYSNHNYEYCEIHPSAMLGVCSAVIPYPEHNQSPRLVYQSSMVKQALGVYALSFQQRFDTVTHVMHYPQKPMVSTKFDKMLHYDEMLTGCNPIVAVLTYGGFNQEDSVMLNRSAVDRGMFVHTCYKTISYEENKKTNCSFERIEVPPARSQNKNADYSKLGKNGIAMKGVPVYKGDIIIGKTLTKVQKDEEEKIDCSLAVGNGEEGIVDAIWEGINEEGYKMVKVRIRQLRVPEIGDKFASRSSQKGVCGLLLSQEDMPFTQEGITPDLMINPHCFTKESKVSLYNGLSKKITDLSSEGGEQVWSYDYKNNGLVGRSNLGMEWKGRRQIVKLTFEDGRIVRCTPDHRFHILNEGGEVEKVEAKDLKLGKDRVMMGMEGVEDINYGDEEGWKLETEYFTFSCKDKLSREKAMAFARILGYVLTDGCVYQDKRDSVSFTCPIHFGHLIDATICVKDIELLTDKTPKIGKCEGGKANTYLVYLPCELSKTIGNLEGVTIGRRTRQDSDWPNCIYDFPKSILREFLASIFGGDGHAPYIQGRSGNHPVDIKFSKSIHNLHKESFEKKINNLCMLLNKFDVGAEIERIREFKAGKSDELFYSYYITIKESLLFTNVIGFRYCTEKMGRTCLYKSYKEFQERVKKQSARILSLVDSYTKKGLSVNKALIEARKEFLETEPALNEYYSLSSKTQIDNRRRASRSSDVLHLNYKYFPTFSEYLNNFGCLEWYSKEDYITDRNMKVFPTYYMRPIRIDIEKEEDTYCIGVQEFHNFLCEGALVMNCLPSRMTMSQLIEMLLGKTSALTGEMGDSTAFSKGSINPTDSISQQLEKLGFERHGNERLFSGYTGEMLEADIFIGTAYYQRLKHLVKDKMHCLTLDHEVLTMGGWKKISEITVDDQIATLGKNDVLVYQKPTHVWRYPEYEGELYHIQSSSIDLTVTSNHRMWVTESDEQLNSFHFVEAKDCYGKGYLYKKDALWQQQGYLHHGTDSFDETHDFMRLFRYHSFTAKEEEWCWKIAASQSRLLINAITHGKSEIVDTRENVDRLQRLCLHAEWSAVIEDIENEEDKKRIIITKGIYHYSKVEKTDERITTHTKSDGIDVMCITVPNEIFYVRRNGKAVWTGNSRARGNVTMMHHQPSEGRSKDGGLRTGEINFLSLTVGRVYGYSFTIYGKRCKMSWRNITC